MHECNFPGVTAESIAGMHKMRQPKPSAQCQNASDDGSFYPEQMDITIYYA